MKEIAACDIDQTLILHDCDLVLAKNLECETVTVKSPYTNEEQTYVVNEKHVELVKNYQARGFSLAALMVFAMSVRYAFTLSSFLKSNLLLLGLLMSMMCVYTSSSKTFENGRFPS